MAEATVLVVDDEPSIREVVTLYLEQAGFRVLACSDGQAALDTLESQTIDLLVLDVVLPGVDGLEITRRLRSGGDTPIIMLTARRAELDRIAGLEMGADDYVVKPFSPRELVSRVRAVLRRASRSTRASGDPSLSFEHLSIDPRTRLVVASGRGVDLTPTEFDLLWTMASHPLQVFTREQLLDAVWHETEYVDPSTVTVHIRRLREKIETDPSNPVHICTIWGVGYRFEP